MKKIITAVALIAVSCSSMSAPLPSGYGPNGPAQNTWQPDEQTRKFIASQPDLVGKLPEELKNQANHDREKVLENTYRERNQIMHSLHLDPKNTGYLYIFLSESMPENMRLRYADSAIWTGGILLFNGINKDHDIPWFVKNVMLKMTRLHDSSPSISLDPRLFQTFGVTSVPAIVYSTIPPYSLCPTKVEKTYVADDGQKIPYRVCAPADETKYWKITGAVSMQYALEQFADDGAPGVKGMLKKLSIGLATGQKVKEMTPEEYQSANGPGMINTTVNMITNNNNSQNYWDQGIGVGKQSSPKPKP